MRLHTDRFKLRKASASRAPSIIIHGTKSSFGSSAFVSSPAFAYTTHGCAHNIPAALSNERPRALKAHERISAGSTCEGTQSRALSESAGRFCVQSECVCAQTTLTCRQNTIGAYNCGRRSLCITQFCMEFIRHSRSPCWHLCTRACERVRAMTGPPARVIIGSIGGAAGLAKRHICKIDTFMQQLIGRQ
jgi:hypothetical protein